MNKYNFLFIKDPIRFSNDLAEFGKFYVLQIRHV